MRFTRILSLVLVLSAEGHSLAAQSTPEAAASAVGTAIANSDWAGAARLMHPVALRQFRDLFSLALTNENLGQAREQLFGFKTTAEASAAPDTVLFGALLKSLLTRQAGYLEALKSATLTPLGHIQQGDTVLVVVRIGLKAGAVAVTQYDVLPFLKDGAVWRGLLKADITNMAAMLKSLVAPVGG